MCSSYSNNTDATKKLRKVTIMTTGSRGDIQPFVAIGVALKRAGYAVRVLTQPSETHTRLLKDFGLEHVPFGIDSDKFMQEDPEARKSMETGDTLNFFKCIARAVEDNTETTCRPVYDEFLAHNGKHRPDFLVVSYLNRYFGLYAKHVLKIPTLEVKLQHWVFDDPKRAPMGMPTLPRGWHKLIQTQLMVPQDYGNFQKLDQCLADIRIAQQEKPPQYRLEDFLSYEQLLDSEVNHSPLLPLLVCQSPIFRQVLHPTLPPPSEHLSFVGPAILETTDQIGSAGNVQSFGTDSDRTKIQEFLAANPEKKPVYMGWGSMIRKSTHEMAIFAVEALQRSNQRGIVLGGAAGLNMEVLKEACKNDDLKEENRGKELLEYAQENVLFVDKAPHEWLFPQVALTIHHGGAGTLNTALRAGVPTIVTPVFGDQYDNSFAVQKLGVGIGFEEQLQKIEVTDLSKAIDKVVHDPAFAAKAKQVGARMRLECGSKAVVDRIEAYWSEQVPTGKLVADVQNWKVATKELKSSNEKKTLRNRVAMGSVLGIATIASLVL